MMRDYSLQRLELREDYRIQKKLARRWSIIALLTAAYVAAYCTLEYSNSETNSAILNSLLSFLLCPMINFGSCMVLTFSILSVLMAITYKVDACLALERIRRIEKSMRNGCY